MKLAEFPNYYRKRLVPILGCWLGEGAVQSWRGGGGLEVGQENESEAKR